MKLQELFRKMDPPTPEKKNRPEKKRLKKNSLLPLPAGRDHFFFSSVFFSPAGRNAGIFLMVAMTCSGEIRRVHSN